MHFKAILRASERINYFLVELPESSIDRRFWTVVFKSFIISFIAVFLSSNGVQAQISNEVAYENLILDYLRLDTRTISEVKGILTPKMKNEIKTNSSGTYKLQVESPLVEYEKMDAENFVRTIQSDLVFTDSSEHRTGLTFTDTLNKKDIPATRRTDIRALRGEDPRFRSKYLKPALGIAGGLGIIISLFYIRSASR